MSIQLRFKELRKCLNLTQTELAEGIGVTRGVIANIELGRVEPKNGLLQMIIEKYKINKDWLKNSTGDMFTSARENIEVEELLYKISQENSELYLYTLKLSQLSLEDFKLITIFIDRLLEKKENN